MRIENNRCLLWCGQQDSNLHALAVEPKDGVTLVKVFTLANHLKMGGFLGTAPISGDSRDVDRCPCIKITKEL